MQQSLYDYSTGGLFYDLDGSGSMAQQQFAILPPGSELIHSDIMVTA